MMNYDKCEKINLQKLSWLITLIFSFYFAKFLSPNIFFRHLRIENWFIVDENVSFSLLIDCYVDFYLGIKWTLFVAHILETKKRWDNTWLDEAVQAYHKFCIVYAYEYTKYKDVIFIATETFVFELKLIAGMNCNSWLKSLCIETVLSTNNYLYWAQ